MDGWANGATDLHHLCRGLIDSDEFKNMHWASFAEAHVSKAEMREEFDACRRALGKMAVSGAAVLVAITLATFVFGYAAGRLLPGLL